MRKVIQLQPNTETMIHNHSESEIWQIISGDASVLEGNKEFRVSSGEQIYLQPLKSHKIKNRSNSDILEFVSFWWDDPRALNKEIESIEKSKKKINEKIFVLPSFPTPNGDLHVGHLAGPYIASDIYKRFNQLFGSKAIYLLGTIGHQTQVTTKANVLNKSFYETAELYTSQIIRTLNLANIHPDVFVRPTSNSTYGTTAQEILLQLYAKKFVEKKEAEALYCEGCQQYLFEAHVIGKCPICMSPGASGNECEICAHFHADHELIEPICNSCRLPAILKPLERLFFSLERFRIELSNYYKNACLSSKIRSFIADAFSRKLPDIPVSHISLNGIEIPITGYEKQRIYSIFELPARYLSAIKEFVSLNSKDETLNELCHKFNTKLFFGYDNAFLRAIAFPAILMAYDSDINLPNLLISNEFYNLDHKKFSTSRNHAVWGQELLEKYSSDIIRFYLSITRPENQQTNFSISELDLFIATTFNGKWIQWLEKLFNVIHQKYNSHIPEAGSWNNESVHFYQDLQDTVNKIYSGYLDDCFSPRRVSLELCNLVRYAIDFSITTESIIKEPTLKNEARTIIALQFMCIQAFSILLSPIMPNFANNLWGALGYKNPLDIEDAESIIRWVPPINEIHIFEGVNKFTV